MPAPLPIRHRPAGSARRRAALLAGAGAAVAAALLAAGAGAGQAAVAPGAACTSPGVSATGADGARYVCNRSGSKLSWVKVPGGGSSGSSGGSATGGSTGAKAGARCTRAGATAGGGAGITLTCVRAGGKLVWRSVKPAKPGTGTTGGSSSSGGGTGGNSGQGTAFPWSPGPDGWTRTGTAPSCAGLAWTLPVDLSTATNILPPGQMRGGNYKAHGGFRFDQRTDNLVTVRAPFEGILYRGAAYLEDDYTAPTGKPELQYLLDIVHPCGFMVRFDHLRTLAPAIKAVFDANVRTTNDTRTTNLPAVTVKAGDVIATEIGHRDTGRNISFDLGIYDLRAKQTTTRSATEIQQIGSSPEMAWHAVCWYDLFGSAASARIRSLPAPGGQAQSDFCR